MLRLTNEDFELFESSGHVSVLHNKGNEFLELSINEIESLAKILNVYLEDSRRGLYSISGDPIK